MRTHWPTLLFVAMLATPASAQDAAQAGAPKAAMVEVAVGTAISERQLTGTAESFPVSAGILYCYMQVSNAADAQVEHLWYKGATEMNRVKLRIGGSPWRTWSTKKLDAGDVGDWRCDIVQEGKVVGSVKFKVE